MGAAIRLAGHEWPWQWVFPATRTYVHRPTGHRRRHHYHESALQRAVQTLLGSTKARFSVKFYMVAISFIVFDLETIFRFTLPLATRAGQVIGIELDAAMVAKARANAERNGIQNAAFHAVRAQTV